MVTCFTPAGFSRFAHSLSRFLGMKCTEAMVLTNQCARANFDAVRASSPKNSNVIQGISLWDIGKPYHTEIQLYKSIQALLENMAISDEKSVQDTTAHLRAIMNDLNDRFWNSYGIDIEDELTVYAQCESTLEPASEPFVCLLEDMDA